MDNILIKNNPLLLIGKENNPSLIVIGKDENLPIFEIDADGQAFYKGVLLEENALIGPAIIEALTSSTSSNTLLLSVSELMDADVIQGIVTTCLDKLQNMNEVDMIKNCLAQCTASLMTIKRGKNHEQ